MFLKQKQIVLPSFYENGCKRQLFSSETTDQFKQGLKSLNSIPNLLETGLENGREAKAQIRTNVFSENLLKMTVPKSKQNKEVSE